MGEGAASPAAGGNGPAAGELETLCAAVYPAVAHTREEMETRIMASWRRKRWGLLGRTAYPRRAPAR